VDSKIIVVCCSAAVLATVFYVTQGQSDDIGLRCDVTLGDVRTTWHFSMAKEGQYTLRQGTAVVRKAAPFTILRSPQNDRITGFRLNLGNAIGPYWWLLIDLRESSIYAEGLSGALRKKIGSCNDDKSQGL
jgi:hypothetical protein